MNKIISWFTGLEMTTWIIIALAFALSGTWLYVAILKAEVSDMKVEKAEYMQAIEDYRHKYEALKAQNKGLHDELDVRDAERKAMREQLITVRASLITYRTRMDALVEKLRNAVPVTPEDAWKVIDKSDGKALVRALNGQ